MRNDEVPLCVDMDGTLVLTDLGVESVLALARRNPFHLFALPFWLLRGIAHFKREVVRRVELDVTRMPCDERVVEWLREESHRPRVLCTASDATLANALAAHVGLFDAVIASDGAANLSGARKADALVARYGERGFDYAGNARADLAVYVPGDLALSLKTRDSRIAATRRGGPIEATTDAGEIHASSLAQLKLHSASGQIRAIAIGKRWSGASEINTDSGRIVLLVPTFGDVALEASTRGPLSSAFGLSVHTLADGSHEAHARYGAGTSPLHVRSTSGEIVLEQLVLLGDDTELPEDDD